MKKRTQEKEIVNRAAASRRSIGKKFSLFFHLELFANICRWVRNNGAGKINPQTMMSSGCLPLSTLQAADTASGEGEGEGMGKDCEWKSIFGSGGGKGENFIYS